MKEEVFSFSFGIHRNKKIIFIHFEYNQDNINLLHQLGVPTKWSQSYKSWYVSDSDIIRKILRLPPKEVYSVLMLNKINPINRPNFIRFVETLRLKSYSENTIKTYATEFAQWLYLIKNFDVNLTQPDQLRSYMLYCVNVLKLSENQIHSKLNALKFYYEQVLQKEYFFFEIPRPKKKLSLPKVLSQSEIKKIFDVTENLKHRVVLKIAYGLRVSEIVELKVNDIDSKRMMFLIRAAKGKKDRYVPLPESILSELRTYYLVYKPHDYLFEGQLGDKFAIRSVQAIFKNAMLKANINKSIGIHGLRHSYATHLLEYGTDMTFIQKLLGHNNVKTTQIYAKVSNTFLSKIVSPLDQI